MVIAELTWPGTWIVHGDREQAFGLELLLYHLDSQLAEANMAMLLLEQQAIVDSVNMSRITEVWHRERAEENAIRQRLEAAAGPMAFMDMEMMDRIRTETAREAARVRRERGEVPSSLLRRTCFLYARGFVYALDNIVKALKVIALHPVPNHASAALASLNEAIPDLCHVRDTAHHPEDRMRGLDRKKNAIQLKPVNTRAIKAEGGGVLVTDCLDGNRYGCTLGDGRYGEVEVGEVALFAARNAIQQVLDSLTWEGPTRNTPT